MKMNKLFNVIVLFSLLFSSLGLCAQDRKIKVGDKVPDVLFQFNFNQYSKQFLIKTVAGIIEEYKGVDIFNHTMHLPKFEPYKHEAGVEEMIVGELGKVANKVLELPLKGATTTFDVYDFYYKTYRPRAIIEILEKTDDSLKVQMKIQVTKLEIDVDAIYVNNHSPGVEIKRWYEVDGGEESKKSQIINPHLRTMLDDIYLKIQSKDDKNLLEIDGNFTGDLNDAKAVLSAEIIFNLKADKKGVLRFNYDSFNVNLFGSENAEEFADHIDLEIGGDSKIGGLESIEIGDGDNRLQKHAIERTIDNKKIEISRLLAQPIIDQIFSEDIQDMVKEQINKLEINPNIEQVIADFNLGIKTKISEIGIINPDKETFDDQLRIAVDIETNRTDKKVEFNPTYEVTTMEDFKKSEQFIFDEISSDRYSMILSISQEFINKAMNDFIAGQEKTILEGKTPDYAWMGPKRAFMIFDDNEQGKFVLDLFAREKFFTRIFVHTLFTGRSKYYFPVVMKPEIKFEIVDEVPNLVVKVVDVDMSKETLRHGAYGVPSNLNKGHLKKVVDSMVRGELKPLVNSEMARIPLTGLKGLNIDEVTAIQSDGHGRINFMIDVSPKKSKARKFTRLLPKAIVNMMKGEPKEGEEASKKE